MNVDSVLSAVYSIASHCIVHQIVCHQQQTPHLEVSRADKNNLLSVVDSTVKCGRSRYRYFAIISR